MSNGIKEKFYRADLPEFQDRLQAFHMASLGMVHQLLTATVGLQAQHVASLKTSLEQTTSTISAVDLGKDVEIYVRENRRVGGWKEPEGWGWEPAEGFYEVGEWATDGPAKVVLQNSASHLSLSCLSSTRLIACALVLACSELARANADLAKTQPNLDSKSIELSSLVTRLTQASAPSAYPSTAGDPDSVSDSLLPLLPEVHRLSSAVTACEIVLDQLQATLGEETGEGKAHEFKSASFTVPAKCKVCEGSIWGLAKPGKSCRNCGVVVHTKCENKVHPFLPPLLARRSRTDTFLRLWTFRFRPTARVRPPARPSLVARQRLLEFRVRPQRARRSIGLRLSLRRGLHLVYLRQAGGWSRKRRRRASQEDKSGCCLITLRPASSSSQFKVRRLLLPHASLSTLSSSDDRLYAWAMV